jgi:hypothetical protein
LPHAGGHLSRPAVVPVADSPDAAVDCSLVEFLMVLVVTLAALGAASRSTAAASDVVRFIQSGSFSTRTGSTGATTDSARAVSASDDQYEEEVTICHRTSGTDQGNTLKLSPSGAANHLQHHQDDYPGPCIL